MTGTKKGALAKAPKVDLCIGIEGSDDTFLKLKEGRLHYKNIDPEEIQDEIINNTSIKHRNPQFTSF